MMFNSPPPFLTVRLLQLLAACSISVPLLTANESNAPGEHVRVLFSPDASDGIAALSLDRTEVTEAEGGKAIHATFEAGGYPKIAFPCPKGGWDLSAYRGIELTVTNLGETAVRGALRVDNPGDHKEQFWNTEVRLLKPGETVTIHSVFGQNNGKPGYPLDASRITAYQFFLLNPKEATVLRMGEPKAYGEPSPEQSRERFSKPEDRQIAVQTPDWIGQQPPVEGPWTLTLDEDFTAGTVDASVWSTHLAIIGPHREEAQRYRDANVALDEGKVRLTTEKNPGHQYDDPTLPRRDYAAGMLSSYDKWTQRYGYFEIRAKMPTARGLAIVFGLIPDRGPDNNLNMHERRTSHDFNGQGMEMDIVRHQTEWGPGRVSYGTRWGGPAGTHEPKNWGDSYVYHGPTGDSWHVYGMLWEPDRLVWYVDGKKTGEWRSEHIANVTSYLSLTMPLSKHSTKSIDESSLPDHWEVDYIRVWQRTDQLPQDAPASAPKQAGKEDTV